jgi:histidinol-phosphate aminotransferase
MTKRLRDLIPAHIREIEPYRPGKPVEEVERELGIRAIKLASNENPLGPSPLAVEAAARELRGANRYPDGGSYYLREKLAARYGVHQEQVFVGLGSSEVIDLAARALLGPGLEGLTAERSYPPYAISIAAAGGTLVTAPLRDSGYDLEAIASQVTPRTRVIYLANPNNPTGTYFHAAAFAAFLGQLREDVLVVLDEAYCDYVEDAGYTRSIEQVRGGRSNLLVLRTFSKVYGLAGLRVGYGIGPAELFVEFNKLKTPFNTPGIGQAAAIAALDDAEHVRRSVEANRTGRKQIEMGLEALGARYVKSSTNFIFVHLESDGDAAARQLLHEGVIVRPMRWMGFPNAIRVSVGTAAENEKFLQALGRVFTTAGGAPAMLTPGKTS